MCNLPEVKARKWPIQQKIKIVWSPESLVFTTKLWPLVVLSKLWHGLFWMLQKILSLFSKSKWLLLGICRATGASEIKFRVTWMAQQFSTASRPGHNPGDPGSSPTSDLEPASTSAGVSPSFSFSVFLMNKYIKSFKIEIKFKTIHWENFSSGYIVKKRKNE